MDDIRYWCPNCYLDGRKIQDHVLETDFKRIVVILEICDFCDHHSIVTSVGEREGMGDDWETSE